MMPTAERMEDDVLEIRATLAHDAILPPGAQTSVSFAAAGAVMVPPPLHRTRHEARKNDGGAVDEIE